ncbi:hypothetical protein CFO_g1936 [Ceratocystis platani]|uniref:Uncharacterized protein n=1 Tax=Ceratocystis fimbriata f. sp. platani TaxID=88771 RepID=A0A0F8CYM0_CERFI|nr:hypothetical protein CFO_g1936 [Ceratocystis platani]
MKKPLCNVWEGQFAGSTEVETAPLNGKVVLSSQGQPQEAVEVTMGNTDEYVIANNDPYLEWADSVDDTPMTDAPWPETGVDNYDPSALVVPMNDLRAERKFWQRERNSRKIPCWLMSAWMPSAVEMYVKNNFYSYKEDEAVFERLDDFLATDKYIYCSPLKPIFEVQEEQENA